MKKSPGRKAKKIKLRAAKEEEENGGRHHISCGAKSGSNQGFSGHARNIFESAWAWVGGLMICETRVSGTRDIIEETETSVTMQKFESVAA